MCVQRQSIYYSGDLGMLQYLVQQLAGELETVEGEKTSDRKQIFRAFGAIGRNPFTPTQCSGSGSMLISIEMAPLDPDRDPEQIKRKTNQRFHVQKEKQIKGLKLKRE